jgi:anti-sigma factor RsiW
MNCKNIQALLSAFVDGELSGQQMLELRAHMADCRCCREEEAEMRLLKSLLTATPMIEPSADFEERLISAVFQHEVEAEPMTYFQSASLLGGISLVAAALTLLVLNFLASSPTDIRSASPSVAIMHDDQTSLQGADPFGGTPIVNTNYGGR